MFVFFSLIALSSAAVAHCKTAISDNHCLECEPGYFLAIDDTTDSGIPNLKCEKVVAIENCELYDGSACVKCYDYFYLENNACHTCKGLHNDCVHCGKVDGELLCLECGNSLSISANEKTCVDCTNAANNEACGRCGVGKYFDISTKSCQPCMANCELCTESYNCFQCKDKTLLTRQVGDAEESTSSKPDSCVTITNCVEEYTKADHCELCVSGYTLKKGGCVQCPTNCVTCYFTDYSLAEADKCTTCTSEFMPKNGACVIPADHHCKEHSSTYGCLECESGYFFKKDETTGILNCEKCDATCKGCVGTATHCLECADNHYFSGSGENTVCLPMDENCEL